MKRIRFMLILFTAVLFWCAGCANWFNQQFGLITSEVSNFSVKMMGQKAVMLSWDPVEDIDGYNIYLKENKTGREACYFPLYHGTSYCIPAGEDYSFAVSIIKGDKENRTDFVTPNRNHLLAVQTKGSYNNTVLVIPPAGNATKTYISFDGSEYMYLVPQNREYILPAISDSRSHYFEIIYEIEQGIQVVSAPYYYTRSSQSELLPRLRSY